MISSKKHKKTQLDSHPHKHGCYNKPKPRVSLVKIGLLSGPRKDENKNAHNWVQVLLSKCIFHQIRTISSHEDFLSGHRRGCTIRFLNELKDLGLFFFVLSCPFGSAG